MEGLNLNFFVDFRLLVKVIAIVLEWLSQIANYTLSEQKVALAPLFSNIFHMKSEVGRYGECSIIRNESKKKARQ